jgi:hypothetical protein
MSLPTSQIIGKLTGRGAETNHTHREKEKSPDTTLGFFNTLFKLYCQGNNAQREKEYPIRF